MTMTIALDTLQRLHAHLLSQAADVGQAIAAIERKANAPAADPASQSWEPVEVVSSDENGTTLRHPSIGFDLTLGPIEVQGLADDITVFAVGCQLRLIGGKIHVLVSE